MRFDSGADDILLLFLKSRDFEKLFDDGSSAGELSEIFYLDWRMMKELRVKTALCYNLKRKCQIILLQNRVISSNKDACN